MHQLVHMMRSSLIISYAASVDENMRMNELPLTPYNFIVPLALRTADDMNAHNDCNSTFCTDQDELDNERYIKSTTIKLSMIPDSFD